MTKELPLEEARARYEELQALQQSIEQYNSHIQSLKERIVELQKVQQVVLDISQVKEGCEILVPVSAGIFIAATAGKTNEFLVNVGSKTVVKQSPEQTKDLIKRQYEELIEMQTTMVSTLQRLMKEHAEKQEALRSML